MPNTQCFQPGSPVAASILTEPLAEEPPEREQVGVCQLVVFGGAAQKNRGPPMLYPIKPSGSTN